MDREEYVDRLRKFGLTPTAQRLAVLEYLDGNRRHPTADEIYQAVHARYPTIVKATARRAGTPPAAPSRRRIVDPNASPRAIMVDV